VNKTVPKNRFKAELSDVQSIRWLYKISPETADFRHGDEITEIQIFEISFKSGTANKKELAAIQKAIPYSVLFLAYSKFYYTIEGELFESETQFLQGDNLAIERRSSKLTDLHEDLATKFIPIPQRASEGIPRLVERYRRLTALDKEIAALQRRVDNEKQPNIRFELNDKLKALKAERQGLI